MNRKFKLWKPRISDGVLDVIAMICVGVGVGDVWFLVYQFRSVILP